MDVSCRKKEDVASQATEDTRAETMEVEVALVSLVRFQKKGPAREDVWDDGGQCSHMWYKTHANHANLSRRAQIQNPSEIQEPCKCPTAELSSRLFNHSKSALAGVGGLPELQNDVWHKMWSVNYSLVYLQECRRPNAHITQTIKVPNLLTRKETPNTDEIVLYLSRTLRSAPLADFLSFYTLWRSAVSYRGTQLCETPGSLERNPSFSFWFEHCHKRL